MNLEVVSSPEPSGKNLAHLNILNSVSWNSKWENTPAESAWTPDLHNYELTNKCSLKKK